MRRAACVRLTAGVLAACCVCVALVGEARGGVRALRAAGPRAASDAAARAGEVVVMLNEEFFNALLEAVLAQPEPPRFPLAKGEAKAGRCASEVILLRESAGRRTAVSLADGRVGAVLAFRGSYEAPLVGCINFEGSADAVFNLAFDPEAQALNARVEVRDLRLKDIPPMLGGGVTGLVQEAIDRRVNPIRLLRAEQLSARLPLGQGADLQLRAREVRHEVTGRELRLRILYDIVPAR